MTPRRGLVGRLAHAPVLRRAWPRRVLLALLAAAFLLLAVYPQRYRAIVSLTPADPVSLGLSGTLGQLGAVNSVFGNQTSVEISLKVAQSPYVGALVMRRVDLPRRLGKTPIQTIRWLDREVDVRAMRGGIVQIETTLADPDLATAIVAAYADAIRAQLAIVARNQTRYKRDILLGLVRESSERLARAQSDYDNFRLRTSYSEPRDALASLGERIPLLEGLIKGKEGELAAARRFATSENFSVQRLEAELGALRAQLAQAKSVSSSASDTVGRAVRESTEVERLKRELDVAQGLYSSYKRFLEGTSVEDLTSTANIRVLEPAYIDPERQYRTSFVGLALLVVVLGLAIEFYNLRPPLGEPEPA